MWATANTTISFLLGTFQFLSQTPEPQIIAETKYGKVEGYASLSRSGRTIYEFLGLPYALPPIGLLRFAAPLPWNITWDGIRDGTIDTQRCTQYHVVGRNLQGVEDCLFMYVYTHKFQRVGESPIPKSELKPVILYLHGGLFMQGSGSFYKPRYLLDEDVVYISMQYRIAALGFLSLDNDDISGNAGLKDQVLGLRWVQEHVKIFGGDPNKVTVMGESAGSVCAHMHLLSPMSKGLFHNVISQSGTALTSWAIRDNPVEQAKYFAKHLGCPTETKEEIAKCLRSMDASKIARGHMEAATILHHRYALFGPTIETRENATTDKFLPDRPENIIKSGNFSKVPFLLGANSEEGLLYAAPMIRNESAREQINANWSYWIPITFRFVDEPNSADLANKIKEFYFGNASQEITEKDMATLTKFVTDRSFMEGLHHTLKLHKGHAHPVYPYYYNYKGQFSFGRIMVGMTFRMPVIADFIYSQTKRGVRKLFNFEEKHFGTTHGDELPLLFNLPFQVVDENSKDYAMSKMLVKTWTTFAKTGVPGPMKEIAWRDINEDDNAVDAPIKLVKIDTNVEIIPEPFNARAKFWESLKMYPEREYYA